MSPHADDIPEEHHALVERLRAGDVDALDALLQSYWRGVVLFATRALGDDEAAQDVAQETFIRLWRARADLTGDRFRAYLYRVARNLVTDEVRRRDVRARVETVRVTRRRSTTSRRVFAGAGLGAIGAGRSLGSCEAGTATGLALRTGWQSGAARSGGKGVRQHRVRPLGIERASERGWCDDAGEAGGGAVVGAGVAAVGPTAGGWR